MTGDTYQPSNDPDANPGALVPGEDDVTAEPTAMPEGFQPDPPTTTPADADEDVVPLDSSDDTGNANAA